MEDFPPSYLYRWTFDLETGAVTETQLDDVSHGFPRVDDRAVGLEHRFGWAAAPRGGKQGDFNSAGVIVRYDLANGTSTSHDLGPSAHPGEFVFVEASEASTQEEGWVMGFVYDEATNSSDLVVLDASDMSAPPVAKVKLPQRVPFGFHGSWIRD